MCETPSHLSYIIFSFFKNGSPAQQRQHFLFELLVPMSVPVPLRAVRKEVKGGRGLKEGWNDIMLREREA